MSEVSPSRAQRRLETKNHLNSSPIEVQRADALYDFMQVPSKSCTLAGEFLGGVLDGVAGTLRFPLERRVSLKLITMVVAAVRVNRALLQRHLGGWAFALAFRLEVFASLDVSCTAATILPPTMMSLYLSQGSILCWKRTLRAEPCAKLYATDWRLRRAHC